MTTPVNFQELGLAAQLLAALTTVGYETPTPIQAQTIPPLLAGKDVLGQAQTGTGKTAAFALPLLQRIDATIKRPQILVLAPTRELAIQVAEAFATYASNSKGLMVLPIYGGADYRSQLQGLHRGAQIIVGTPGRVVDHIRKGSLKLDSLAHLVLDEADEMLRMGFIEDVEWVLSQAPSHIQKALFSATMPKQIKKITETYLQNPAIVRIAEQNRTAATITQQYWNVAGTHKLDALTRILDVYDFDAVLVFVRTKTATTELAEKLQARGHAATALNGDIDQKQRQRIVKQLKGGQIDILVATDVAARGLDVERISLVVNFDIPYDPEAYVHRIGRTGRAGRSGMAILFVAPREQRMLAMIERMISRKIDPIKLPSKEMIKQKRVEKIGLEITALLSDPNLQLFEQLVEDLQRHSGASINQVSAALLLMREGNKLVSKEIESPLPPADNHQRNLSKNHNIKKNNNQVAAGMARFRIQIGHNNNLKPRDIVAAITNAAALESRQIGPVKIYDTFSLVDLPDSLPESVISHCQSIKIHNKPIYLSRDTKAKPARRQNNRPQRSRPSPASRHTKKR